MRASQARAEATKACRPLAIRMLDGHKIVDAKVVHRAISSSGRRSCNVALNEPIEAIELSDLCDINGNRLERHSRAHDDYADADEHSFGASKLMLMMMMKMKIQMQKFKWK